MCVRKWRYKVVERWMNMEMSLAKMFLIVICKSRPRLPRLISGPRLAQGVISEKLWIQMGAKRVL